MVLWTSAVKRAPSQDIESTFIAAPRSTFPAISSLKTKFAFAQSIGTTPVELAIPCS